jgi:hypothetical protein
LQPGSGRLAARRLRQIAAREGRLRGLSRPGQPAAANDSPLLNPA